MPSWRSREELTHQTVLLARGGMARRAIARALGVSRNTVRKILERHTASLETPHTALPTPPARAPRDTKVTPFAATVTALLTRYPDITAQRVFEELRAQGYGGAYTAVKRHVRAVRPVAKPEPSRVTPVYGPGVMAESDWTPTTVPFTAVPSATVQIFGYLLRHSTRKNFLVYERSDFYALMEGHVATFARFEGVAQQCKYDGQKAVLLGWEGEQPIFNPRFVAFATHYGFRPVAARPRKPNDKPRIERSFWEYERSFLNGRSFRDVDDLRAQLAHWVDTICDPRVHAKSKRSSASLFDDERPHLLPLPRHPYDTARVIYRVCSIDGFIAWDGNRYAVPYDALYDLLPVRVTLRELFVYGADLKPLVRHELAPRSAGLDVAPPGIHLPRDHRRVDVEPLRASFEALGDGGPDFFADLLRRGPRLCSYHARQILQLRERFGSDDLVAALRHAHSYGAWEHTAIARILQARARPRTLAEYVLDDTADRLAQALGRRETEPRDLSEYDRLPVVPPPAIEETPCEENATRRPPSYPPTTR